MTSWNTDPPRIAAALAVSLIASDGVIDEEEKELAIEIGQRMLPGFSRAAFESILAHIDELPSPYEIAHPLKKKLDDEAKDQILDYLVTIAGADLEVVQVEAQEIEAVAQALGVPMPPFAVSKPSLDE